MKKLRTFLSCVLALCLVLGCLPMHVHALEENETERDDTVVTEPTTVPTAAPPDETKPAEPEAPETTAPTQPDDEEPETPETTAPAKPDDEEPETPETTAPAKPDDEEPETPETTTPTQPDDEEPEETEPAEDVIVSGACGQEAKWTLNETTGVMAIFGTGIMNNYSSDSLAPWSESADKIKTLVVEDGITRLGSYAFFGCKNLTKVTMADSLLTTGSHVFAGCTKLEEVTLSKNLEEIAIQAFDGCAALKAITIPEAVTAIGVSAFTGCTTLAEVTIPETVTTLGGSAFSGCTGLKTVKLDAKITTLEESVFYGCTGLTAMTVPEGVKTISARAFYNCTGLKQLTLPAALMTIGSNTFYNCTSLEALELSESLTGIGESAFENCAKIPRLSFPKKLSTISSKAFAGCTGIEQMDFVGNAPSIAADAFTKVTANAFYPNGNTTWEESLLVNYGGTLSWFASCPDEHVMGTVGSKAATCEEDGYTGDTACTVCGLIETKGEVIKALGHNITGVKPLHATGTKTHNYTCQRCGEDVPEGCTFGEAKVIQEATMGQPGLKQYTCQVCGGTYTEEYSLESTVTRIYGSNRYETAFDVADAMKKTLGLTKFDTVIVASGTTFPDALSGSYLACIKNAPILLVNPKAPAALTDYISANLKAGGKVYLLGGTSAVPQSLETDLIQAGFDVDRLAGDNRYATNLAILKEAGVGTKDILVCTGTGFADSLSASSVNRPILLVNKSLTQEQKDFLNNLNGANKIYIIGGESAVSASLENTLKAYGEVERVGGANRFETSVLVAHTFVKGPQGVVLAYSHNFPDGLCGGPLAYSMGSALVLTADKKESAAQEYVQRYKITNGIVLGGTGLISDKTVETIFSPMEDAE